jgi:hypothetical protein
MNTPKELKKFIVAIHGIGDQRRNATIRSVATRFGDLWEPPLASEPLGFFSIGDEAEVSVRRIELKAGVELGFAEVYWADIPRKIALSGDTLDESKHWGDTVASRAEQMYQHAATASKASSDTAYRNLGFDQVPGVIEEFVEGIGVIESLTSIAAKLGFPKVQLGPLLSDYVGGVQLVAEFKYRRTEIIDRFNKTLSGVVAYAEKECACREPEIYIVAHSEGSVVSFAGLLQALQVNGTSPRTVDDESENVDWILRVRGFMTFGSPIDKHLLLFPGMWEDLGLPRYKPGKHAQGNADAPSESRWRSVGGITWFNFYDYGDPIGFELDTARDYLAQIGCTELAFDASNDYGFARYPLPGAAHTGYWKDDIVFKRFIYEVVFKGSKEYEPTVVPKSRCIDRATSWVVPYGAALILHLLAVFFLFKPFAHEFCKLELLPFTFTVLGIGLLYAGTTVAARLPRIVSRREMRWWFVAVAAFAIGCIACQFLYTGQACLLPLHGHDSSDDNRSVVWVLIIALGCIVLLSWVRWKPRWGRRLLLLSGSLLLFVVVGWAIHGNWPSSGSKPLTQIAIGGAAFVYFWWLGIVIFDLTFVWHRYIRRSVALEFLRIWSRGELKPVGLYIKRAGMH